MKLETAESTLDNPSTDQIRETLGSLDGLDNYFAILAADDMTYMQTSGSPSEGFVLEYQDGSLDRHFRTDGEPLSLDVVAAAFSNYLMRDNRWEARFTWVRDDLEARPGCGSASAILLVGMGLGIQIARLVA